MVSPSVWIRCTDTTNFMQVKFTWTQINQVQGQQGFLFYKLIKRGMWEHTYILTTGLN